MRATLKGRIIWAFAIGVPLIMAVMGVIVLIDASAISITEPAKRCASNIWQSQWPIYLGCAIGAHEGLAAGMFGAAGALFAAWLAWEAVQEQIGEERERERRRQLEAKPVAALCLAAPINAAAAALSAINNALHAATLQDVALHNAVTIMATHVKSTLDSPSIWEGFKNLGLQDRLYFLAVIATINGFVDVCLRPSPVKTRMENLEIQRRTLMTLHHHLAAFDQKLANDFAENSRTSAADAPPITNTVDSLGA